MNTPRYIKDMEAARVASAASQAAAKKQNAFTMVRPQGPNLDIPAALPRKTNHSKAPKSGNVHKLLDSNGRAVVGLERRTKGAIVIESREQSAASLAKSRRISKAA